MADEKFSPEALMEESSTMELLEFLIRGQSEEVKGPARAKLAERLEPMDLEKLGKLLEEFDFDDLEQFEESVESVISQYDFDIDAMLDGVDLTGKIDAESLMGEADLVEQQAFDELEETVEQMEAKMEMLNPDDLQELSRMPESQRIGEVVCRMESLESRGFIGRLRWILTGK